MSVRGRVFAIRPDDFLLGRMDCAACASGGHDDDARRLHVLPGGRIGFHSDIAGQAAHHQYGCQEDRPAGATAGRLSIRDRRPGRPRRRRPEPAGGHRAAYAERPGRGDRGLCSQAAPADRSEQCRRSGARQFARRAPQHRGNADQHLFQSEDRHARNDHGCAAGCARQQRQWHPAGRDGERGAKQHLFRHAG